MTAWTARAAQHRQWFGSGAALLAGTAAIAGAVLTGASIGPINAGVEGLAGASNGLLSDFGLGLPLGYAFAAGLVAALNPCGFALLPGYLGLYLGEPPRPGQGVSHHLGRALEVSAALTTAFVLLFAAAGVGFSFAAAALARQLPWVGLAIGLALLIVGGRQLAGQPLYAGWSDRLAEQFGQSSQRTDLRGFFAYGLAYGLGSLGCTLPIFLAVVGTAWTADGPLIALRNYVAYGMGMGSIITVLTFAAALFEGSLLKRVRALTPVILLGSSVLVLLAGAYVVYYWLTIGGILRLVL